MIELALTLALTLQPEPQRADLHDLSRCFGSAPYRTADGVYTFNLPPLLAAREKASPAEWEGACRQGRAATERLNSVIRTILRDGASPVGGFGSAVQFSQAARTANDPVVKELLLRTARDQALRLAFDPAERARYAGGLTPLATLLLDGPIGAQLNEVDTANTAWLKQTLKTRGWFTLTRDGKQADRAAWLLVQHADLDRPFQEEVLAMLGALAPKGETDRVNYAYLYDRVASGAGRPQRYGTQGRCVGPGRWEPNSMEDPETVDVRRREVGIDWSMEAYKAGFKDLCT